MPIICSENRILFATCVRRISASTIYNTRPAPATAPTNATAKPTSPPELVSVTAPELPAVVFVLVGEGLVCEGEDGEESEGVEPELVRGGGRIVLEGEELPAEGVLDPAGADVGVDAAESDGVDDASEEAPLEATEDRKIREWANGNEERRYILPAHSWD